MKSLNNMLSGICQNQYPAIENGMDVGKKQKNKQTTKTTVKVIQPACMV